MKLMHIQFLVSCEVELYMSDRFSAVIIKQLSNQNMKTQAYTL